MLRIVSFVGLLGCVLELSAALVKAGEVTHQRGGSKDRPVPRHLATSKHVRTCTGLSRLLNGSVDLNVCEWAGSIIVLLAWAANSSCGPSEGGRLNVKDDGGGLGCSPPPLGPRSARLGSSYWDSRCLDF